MSGPATSKKSVKKQYKFPTQAEIQDKKGLLLKNIEQKISDDKIKKNPTNAFLVEISDEILSAINKNMSYASIADVISKTYGVKITSMNVSKFASEHLGIQKNNKKKNTDIVSEYVAENAVEPQKMNYVDENTTMLQ